MNDRDRTLGMTRDISRRDFANGVAMVAGSLALPISALGAAEERYSYTYDSLYDPMEWVFTETASRPCVIARQPYGLISIANADAAASPHTDAAILEAHRAVGEVLERRAFPFVPRDTTSA